MPAVSAVPRSRQPPEPVSTRGLSKASTTARIARYDSVALPQIASTVDVVPSDPSFWNGICGARARGL